MKSGYVQSALRELQSFFQSPRFWATILIVAVVFTIVGPFGTAHSMPFIRRLAFWLLLHTTAFAIASIIIVFIVSWWGGTGIKRLATMMVGAAIAAVPIGIAVEGLQAGFADQGVSLASALEQIKVSLLLSPLLCALTYLTMSGPHPLTEQVPLQDTGAPLPEQAAMPEQQATPAPAAAAAPPILARLKPQHRGRLLRLSVQDHYTEVVTSRGRELILLRFADAVTESAPVPGQRIHRSHWIADDHVGWLKKDNGKLLVVTASGTALPVSRPYEAEMRAKFADRTPPNDTGSVTAS
ncbi:LytTR family DNA-binding domain-containing protein [Rhizobium oryzicola]|uniref:LytTR family DNA-binding domain-containing protein n=1 Tax=Rhizobium oryzicola TaxID=1232668 RepID=A0ABT8SVM8_9HYPH|nr:LytTR family DNA-binding domain-containing protein [Rhizobium oryzicola]MDO1582376.1 LytTR family DNA-binding domain-containing protein [Rhizobium oryzicola]